MHVDNVNAFSGGTTNKIRFGEDIRSENKGHMSHFLDGTACAI